MHRWLPVLVIGALMPTLSTVGMPGREAQAGTAASTPGFVLRIDGDRGTRFEVVCRVRTRDGEEEHVLQGNAPLMQIMPGWAIECRLQTLGPGGPLRVELHSTETGATLRSRVQGPGNQIRLRLLAPRR